MPQSFIKPYDDPRDIVRSMMAQRQGIPGQQQGPAFPAYSPEEEQSLLGKWGGVAASGLGYVGSTLDKAFGGRAIRGLLGGKPEELASLIPFSDTLGITDPANAVKGRDLLEQAGMIEPSRPGFQWGDIAGMGAELALDPATLLLGPGKALTKAGLGAAKLGRVPLKPLATT